MVGAIWMKGGSVVGAAMPPELRNHDVPGAAAVAAVVSTTVSPAPQPVRTSAPVPTRTSEPARRRQEVPRIGRPLVVVEGRSLTDQFGTRAAELNPTGGG